MKNSPENQAANLLESNSKYFEVLNIKEQHDFINNLLNDKAHLSLEEYMSKAKYVNGLEFISEAFDWDKTDQGYNHWMDIAESMKRICVDYDVPPKSALENQVILLNYKLEDLSEENLVLKSQLTSYLERVNDFKKTPRDVWDEIQLRMVTSSPYRSEILINSQEVFHWLSNNYLPPFPIKKW